MLSCPPPGHGVKLFWSLCGSSPTPGLGTCEHRGPGPGEAGSGCRPHPVVRSEMHPAGTHAYVTAQLTRGPRDASCRGTAGAGADGPRPLRSRSEVVSSRKPFPVPSEGSPGPHEGLRTLVTLDPSPSLALRQPRWRRPVSRTCHLRALSRSVCAVPSALSSTQLALSPRSGPCRL